MKFNWKRTITVLTVAGLLTAGAAAASAVRQTITAQLRSDITVELNGSKQALQDSQGNPIYPISYNGSTYLPIRAIGETMGLTVDWDSATQTVDLVGEVASSSNPGNTDLPTTGSDGETYIGRAKAKAIALADAGLAESGVTFIRVDMDRDDGRWVYEVEFYYGSKEYDYDIDALTGEIRSRDYDVENFTIPTSSGSDIGAEKAKSIALSHAGLTSSQVTFVKVERDWDDGRLTYEVEFYQDGKEYDYEIAASDGTVLSVDYDAESYRYQQHGQNSTGGQGNNAPSDLLTAEQAKAIALEKAGLSSGDVTFQKAELDRDDGCWEYELEFRSGRTEYEYTIHATTGAVLDAEVDRD